MIAEIISVGSELLMGQIVNTNARYLSQKLAELGISLYFESVVGDNLERLKEQLALAGSRSDVVILTGGLGPTQDDLTKWAVADVLGLEMLEDAKSRLRIQEMFSRRKIKGEITTNNYRQAVFPLGAMILNNEVGTAPGCIVEGSIKSSAESSTPNIARNKKCSYILLPGPPVELKNMFETSVFEYLQEKSGAKIQSRFIKVFGIGESKLETILGDVVANQTNPSIAMYASGQIITVRVTARVLRDESAEEMLDKSTNQILGILGDSVFSVSDQKLEEVVVSQLKLKKQRISIAESLTGGMLSSLLVSVAGASEVLLESIVTYTNSAKIRLGVAPEILEKFGAASEECAKEMAEAIMKRTGSDWAVSTTGVAGPGNDVDGNEAGLYYCCIMNKNSHVIIKNIAGGERNRVRLFASLSALNQLRLNIIAN